jgi:Fe-S-cluster containining protein
MGCTFCHDICCSYGVDIDILNVNRIMEQADAIEAYTGQPRDTWFSPDWVDDKEFPGGKQTRTEVVNGRCVFLNRKGRGCMIHSFCLQNNTDYHDLKPMVSVLFPLTFAHGLLRPSEEILDETLVCIDKGPTLYQGIRDELAYYFGDELVKELDAIKESLP